MPWQQETLGSLTCTPEQEKVLNGCWVASIEQRQADRIKAHWVRWVVVDDYKPCAGIMKEDLGCTVQEVWHLHQLCENGRKTWEQAEQQES